MSAFVKDPERLRQQMGLPRTCLSDAAHRLFPLKVPAHFLNRIRPGDPDDPLLRQILPVSEETRTVPGFTTDAVGDLQARPAPGVLHKYRGRALIMLTPRCDIHCRFCFRRHFPYEDNTGRHAWEATLDWLRQHTDIREVILSGGDPFTLSETMLTERCRTLETALPHLHTLRIHTRTPIVAPDRAPTGVWLDWFQQSRLHGVMVVHCNHPDELSADTARLLAQYRTAGLHLLNQSVLLRGVNDRGETLAQLSTALFEQGVLPYYLHLLDRVAGTAHFEVPEARARELIQYLRERLPGYLVPRLVREIPGEPCKTPMEEGRPPC